jgi:hypothetical protein
VSRSYAMSIDTGGTFTDGFVSDGEHTVQVKVDTTPQDLTIGFEACVEAAAAAVGRELPAFLGSLTRLHFSSTIATNTIVEGRGARVGLIVTRGAEQSVYGTAPQADALHRFVEPDLVRGVSEQVDAAGAVLAAPDEAETELAVRELLERGVRLLVVSFANAHLNQANELRARELLGESYPRHYLGAVPLMVASRVSLAADDHGRTACAVVNACLHPGLVRRSDAAKRLDANASHTTRRTYVCLVEILCSSGRVPRSAPRSLRDRFDPQGPSARASGMPTTRSCRSETPGSALRRDSDRRLAPGSRRARRPRRQPQGGTASRDPVLRFANPGRRWLRQSSPSDCIVADALRQAASSDGRARPT